MIRRRKEEVLDLPPKLRSWLDVEVAPGTASAEILALARVLTRPAATVYQTASSSDPGKFHTLTFEANEVTCTCPGFEYRGTCRHARELKAALVNKQPVPPHFRPAGGP